MNQMEIFKNPEFGAIRAVEIDGEPWLVGKDVALALGYKNPQEAIRNHVAQQHPDQRIVSIDRDSKDYEVKLSNGVELKFDLKFSLIGFDD